MAKKVSTMHKKENPAISQAKISASIKKSIDDAHQRGIEFALMTAKLFSYMILSDKFGFTNEQLETFRTCMNELGDSLYKEYFKIEDILGVCMNEYNLKFTFEELKIIDPTFNSFTEVTDTQKINK